MRIRNTLQASLIFSDIAAAIAGNPAPTGIVLNTKSHATNNHCGSRLARQEAGMNKTPRH